MPFYMNLEQTTVPPSLILSMHRQFLSLEENWVRLVSLFLMEELFLLSFQNGGTGYSGPPDIVVECSANTEAFGAILRAEVTNGAISAVKVISGGVGYAQTNTALIFFLLAQTSDCKLLSDLL